MDDRNQYGSRQHGDDYRSAQPEQWDDRSYRGEGGSQDYDWRQDSRFNDDSRGGMRRSPRMERVNVGRGGRRWTEEDRVRLQDDYERRDTSAERGYRQGRYGPAPDRGYGRFTSESYGGRDFADTARAPYYGYAAGAGAGGLGAEYPSPYDYDSPRHGYDRGDYHDRGFFERAGDEIASWFGDDDAARRREMDHRGKGPQGYQRSDERILEDVCDRLTEDRFVDAREITVTVENSEVTLNGTVPMKQAKRRAEDCADHVSGVGHVQNNLRVRKNTETA